MNRIGRAASAVTATTAILIAVSPALSQTQNEAPRPQEPTVEQLPGRVVSGAEQQEPGDVEKITIEAKKIAEGNNRFALDLYRRLAAANAENLFFSPTSISTAFAMAFAGARGQTEQQTAEVLHFPLPQDQLHAAFQELNAAIAGAEEKDYQLQIANRLWGQQGYDFLPEFLRITREYHGAELAEVDFARQAEEARGQINRWVEEQTEQKITDLIPSGVLDDMTRLVLTNAIYFKGQWTSPFDEQLTADAPFHLAGGETVEVPMMRRQDNFAYFADEQLQALRLPYGEGEELSMVILLPRPSQRLAALEEQLSAEQLNGWLEGLRSREVRVELPRFRMTSQFQLNETLQSMGMTDAFTPDVADFSGMNGRRNLFISAAIHKAFVEVNEEGTEAAAATGIAIGITAAPVEPPPQFTADRPFLFLIRHEATGSLLFLGRVTDPREQP